MAGTTHRRKAHACSLAAAASPWAPESDRGRAALVAANPSGAAPRARASLVDAAFGMRKRSRKPTKPKMSPSWHIGNQLFYLIMAADAVFSSCLRLRHTASIVRLELVPFSRLIDVRALNRAVPAVSWHGSASMLHDLLNRSAVKEGEVEISWSSVRPPSCNHNMSRWSATARAVSLLRCRPSRVLRVSCCLMWGWRMGADAEAALWPALRFRSELLAAARAMAEQRLGPAWNAIHAADVAARLRGAGFAPSVPVYVATDERNARWFEPVRQATTSGGGAAQGITR
ncbi:hypothetical protein EMIHUDRAFT_202478 [Emiliania huxleyi CCMP1516]|uniref:Uncharacterized protein n=2 Tax=Emiliania huxleyi TaxID=2903 RepID=A0A0D3K880_EMIH1|nr:hypothetical protein EMIHUDRAFT_240651 [Emiliania huxleyi CCMP1516]XP_005784394.1 hypothetical protein EMIHUDRAFT_202478 [Emiliania huxleyi CCMP1516]EOD21984.1 hypothetical protein EMIHUDRAFT_240651 [Emiliania huxleyi CCMP1516]EOD31965.1 hypothetical protein EMIHUDRAFT_202478 [Emiliania huxleyi CCMP1516]|eukprot:XP_005774413.1 hypothetical protein EMIHUDRAFT_240651 [Emiliania huxleyi CCMP1516]